MTATSPDAVACSFVSAWNRHDAQALAALFAPDAHFVNVVGILWKGVSEIEAAHSSSHQTMFRNSKLEQLDLNVRSPASDLTLARVHWRLTGHRSPTDLPLPARTGFLLLVMICAAGDTWQIVDAQNTDIVEGALSRPQ